MQLKFLRFDYQVLVDGSLVIVLDSYEKAKRLLEEHYKQAGGIILPVPVFAYSST